MNYIKQLDSIRAIALFLVVLSHWMTANPLVMATHPAGMGVNTFFVLSGFLITSILLRTREEYDLSDANKLTAVKIFFIRRSLRIFPIYYLTVFTIFSFSSFTDTHIRENFGYYLTYTSNFYFYKIGTWDGMVSHLWSLAVEEQFYLLWPWVMFFIPRKYILPGILFFITIGIISNYIFSPRGLGFVLPFTCFDAFGLGALLAYIMVFHKEQLAKTYRVCTVLGVVCSFILVYALAQHQNTLIPGRTDQAFIALWIITYILYKRETNQKIFFVLNSRVLIFLGKISYGMYLYHLPLAYDYPYLHKYINLHLPAFFIQHEFYVVFLENSILLVLLSWLSWKFLERPILGLKAYFENEVRQEKMVQA
ncbi:acyltransferase family protein [Hymenobacter sp. DG25A]|uniref:acyltransferase family protein n=1 Tax=Hymenobacter sp. DG25A TaxID=1385663 RepID=UPI0006BD3A83|nr:acyltransferase [Hymenobacter sp. DG25A]ALD22293.1 hypothetical protein AM218_15085 [Hymenobacter sp. DG25A]